MIHRRNKLTGQAQKRFPVAGTVITVAAIVTAIYWALTQTKPVEAKFEPVTPPIEIIDLKDMPCDRLEDGTWDCSEDKTLRARMEVKNTVTVIRTRYSRADSCHNPSGNKCLTAIGKDTVEGRTVACPRSWKLGTHVRFVGENRIYVCEDRYSKWVDTMRPYGTVDVFAEAPNLRKLPAHEVVEIEILK